MSIESAASLATVISFIAVVVQTVFWLWIKDRCVTKADYNARVTESDKKRELQDTKIADLERKAELAEQPVSAVVKKLGEIEQLIKRYFEEHRAETAKHREEQARQRTEIELLKQKTSTQSKRGRGSIGR